MRSHREARCRMTNRTIKPIDNPKSDRLLAGLARNANVNEVATAGGCMASRAIVTRIVRTIATPAAK